MLPLLIEAARIALPNDDNDSRGFWLGCIGIREDGTQVKSKNGSVQFSNTVQYYQLVPSSHAEGRVLRKLGKNGVLYVARVAKKDGKLAMAMPCKMCAIRIASFKVNKVYYTINEYQYGIWHVDDDYHVIHSD